MTAAMSTIGAQTPAFTVEGRRVLVVGAARSGVAAAELLARRGAAVTLTDRAASIAAADELRAAGVALDLGGHDPRLFVESDLLRSLPCDVVVSAHLAIVQRYRGQLRFDERYDLAIPARFFEYAPVQALLETLTSPLFRLEVEALGGYDVTPMGTLATS